MIQLEIIEQVTAVRNIQPRVGCAAAEVARILQFDVAERQERADVPPGHDEDVAERAEKADGIDEAYLLRPILKKQFSKRDGRGSVRDEGFAGRAAKEIFELAVVRQVDFHRDGLAVDQRPD